MVTLFILRHMFLFVVDFSILEKIPTPTFSFGGQTGNRESVLILQKKDST